MIRGETLHDNTVTMYTCKINGGCEETREGVSVDGSRVREHFHVYHTDPPDIAPPYVRHAERGRPETVHRYPPLNAVSRQHLVASVLARVLRTSVLEFVMPGFDTAISQHRLRR